MDCLIYREIADEIGIAPKTVSNWISKNRKDPEFTKAPESLQHFDMSSLFRLPLDEEAER